MNYIPKLVLNLNLFVMILVSTLVTLLIVDFELFKVGRDYLSIKEFESKYSTIYFFWAPEIQKQGRLPAFSIFSNGLSNTFLCLLFVKNTLSNI